MLFCQIDSLFAHKLYQRPVIFKFINKIYFYSILAFKHSIITNIRNTLLSFISQFFLLFY